jgi:hypothetical protein
MYYLAKVSFNSVGWQYPSGMTGKITAHWGNHYETIYGFGWEEWNFNPNRNHDGLYFGFLQGVNSNNIFKFSDNEYTDLFLFTQSEGRYYIVAYIESFYVPKLAIRDSARLYLDKGLMRKQADQAGANLNQFDKDFINCVNFAFKNYKLLYSVIEKEKLIFTPPNRKNNFKDIHEISEKNTLSKLDQYKILVSL